MKKILIIGLCLFLAGCSGGLSKIIDIANPVGNNELGGAIATYGVLDAAVIAYHDLPRCTVTNNFSATNICHKRSVLVTLQGYDKTANLAINKAVAYQRANPTLDASSYITAAISAVDVLKSYAQTNGLPGVQ